MSVRDLIPWNRNNQSPMLYRDRDYDPFQSLHREVDRLFDNALRGFDLAPAFDRFNGGSTWPSIEITETDNQIEVAAEIPGLDEKDVEITLQDGVLSLRGEKRTANDDKDKHFSERFYGRFERRIAVGTDIDEDKVNAKFRKGVLTVTLPKTAKAQASAKHIAISKDK